MKKLLLIIICLFSLSAFSQEKQIEIAPNSNISTQFTELDTFNLQFSFPCAAFIGEYGVNTNGIDYYVTQWLDDSIARYDNLGNVLETFTIPGVERVRDLAYDGQYYYGSPADFYFHVLDLDNKTLVNTINTPFSVRGMAYDPVENVLWATELWSPIFYKMDLQGNILTSFTPSGVTMDALSGLAIDNITAGGPFLWGFSQDSSGAMIVKYDITNQMQTGNMIDVSSLTTEPSYAGGLFISLLQLDNGPSIGGMIQNQLVFALDLAYANMLTGLEENIVLPELQIYPNPVVDELKINLSSIDRDYTCFIYNQTGQMIKEYLIEEGSAGTLNINTSTLTPGMYYVSINSDGLTVTKKFLKVD